MKKKQAEKKETKKSLKQAKNKETGKSLKQTEKEEKIDHVSAYKQIIESNAMAIKAIAQALDVLSNEQEKLSVLIKATSEKNTTAVAEYLIESFSNKINIISMDMVNVEVEGKVLTLRGYWHNGMYDNGMYDEEDDGGNSGIGM